MATTSSQQLSFTGGSGHSLAAHLELPQGEPHSFAVFAPCFTCVKDAKAIVHMSRALAERGIAVLRYDVTGIGTSDGDFAATDLGSQADDLVAAADHLRARHRAPRLVIGISLGGAVALTGARRIPEAAAVVTVNAPSDTVHLRDLLLRLAPAILDDGEAEVELLGKRTRIGRRLVEDLPRHSITDAAASLDLPLLICHAPDDRVVPVRHAERLLAVASHPKSLLAVAGTDHLLLGGDNPARWLGEMVAAWALRNLG